MWSPGWALTHLTGVLIRRGRLDTRTPGLYAHRGRPHGSQGGGGPLPRSEASSETDRQTPQSWAASLRSGHFWCLGPTCVLGYAAPADKGPEHVTPSHRAVSEPQLVSPTTSGGVISMDSEPTRCKQPRPFPPCGAARDAGGLGRQPRFKHCIGLACSRPRSPVPQRAPHAAGRYLLHEHDQGLPVVLPLLRQLALVRELVAAHVDGQLEAVGVKVAEVVETCGPRDSVSLRRAPAARGPQRGRAGAWPGRWHGARRHHRHRQNLNSSGAGRGEREPVRPTVCGETGSSGQSGSDPGRARTQPPSLLHTARRWGPGRGPHHQAPTHTGLAILT